MDVRKYLDAHWRAQQNQMSMSGHCSETLGRDLQTQYRAKHKAIKRRCDKRKQIADLARDAEEAAFNGDIKTISKMTKQLINKNLTTQQPVKDENERLLNSDEEQLDGGPAFFRYLTTI